MIRVLIVDDSATMRALIRQFLSLDSGISVVGEASNAHEARAAIKALSPDVITLDINMPQMSGLEFLEKLMRLRPMPAVVFSSAGHDIAKESLSLGGVFFVRKPTNGDITACFKDLTVKLKLAARQGQDLLTNSKTSGESKPIKYSSKYIAIGASTGGVDAIQKIAERLPVDCPPIVVTQHMPKGFTNSFAMRLNKICALEVLEASDGAELKTGRLYIAPGGDQHLEVVGRTVPRCKLVPGPLTNGHRPSVDKLFLSMVQFGKNAVGVLLTGMGRDGAAGLLAMKNAGSITITQDQSTSLVYGMPKVAFEIGAATHSLPIHKIGDKILEACTSNREDATHD